MPTNFFKIPRWTIFCIDLGLVFLGLSSAFLLRFNFNIPFIELQEFPISYSALLLVRAITFFISKTYQGIIRYTSSDDILRITSVLGVGSLILIILNFLRFYYEKKYFIPISVIIIEFFTTSFFMIIPRLMVKLIYHELKSRKKPKWDVIIYGAGDLGITAKRTLDRDRATKYNIIAFVDNNHKRSGSIIEGIKVFHAKEFKKLIDENNVSHVIISTQDLSKEKKQEIVDLCLDKNITVRDVPPIERWINGELSFNQIKHIKIEDLLGRDEIQVDTAKIKNSIKDKTVLVTGAAGSIGSELVKQIIPFLPQKIILFDQAESGLYDLNIELLSTYSNQNWDLIIGDINNKKRINHVFKKYQPQIVFHAAAYKHVPLMEENVSEAVITNIAGTKNLADMSVLCNVEKFVMISTDKAVNPTNVMGASKRIAEIYTQSLGKTSSTKFITTRFGNVLGSNGSVIPLFRKQIAKGGPITVTHPEVTRYFMTIPEACQLVLEAATMGKGGEIFVFDMGESVKIIDLAKKMIKLSGLELGKDIEIKFTGLRPGEKLEEELLNEKENVLPTHHPKIMIGKVREYDFTEIQQKVGSLIHLVEMDETKEEYLVKKMKELVPEYISQNSEFCILDT